MFLNKTQLKKNIKNAVRNGGLVVGSVYDGLVLSSGYWIVWTEESCVQNWLKAAVVEYTGGLPDKEIIFKAMRNEPLQYEVAENPFYDLPSRFRESHYSFSDTNIIVDGNLHLFQEKDTSNIICMPECFIEMFDFSELQGDNRPMGPVSANRQGDVLIWKNENAAYAVCRIATSKDKTLEILGKLREIKFEKE